MASKLKQYIKEEYKKLSDIMNKEYTFFKLLREYYEKYGSIPKEYEKNWKDFQIKDAGFLWYEQKNAVRTLWKTAKIHAKRRVKNEK